MSQFSHCFFISHCVPPCRSWVTLGYLRKLQVLLVLIRLRGGYPFVQVILPSTRFVQIEQTVRNSVIQFVRLYVRVATWKWHIISFRRWSKTFAQRHKDSKVYLCNPRLRCQTEASMSRPSQTESTYVQTVSGGSCLCPDFRAFARLSCVHVQNFVRSPDFRAFMSRLSCVHQTFVRSCSDFRTFFDVSRLCNFEPQPGTSFNHALANCYFG